ncbi:MAG: hypothetical protein ACXV8Q_00285 [Methylobacter sp.]
MADNNSTTKENINERIRHSVTHRQPVVIEVSVELYEFALRWETTPAAIVTDYLQRIIAVDKLSSKQKIKTFH